MARGGDDSDEERHDRFRSERNTTSLKLPLTSATGSTKRAFDLPQLEDCNSREKYRTDRDRNRDRRGKDERRNSVESRGHKRKSWSREREIMKKAKSISQEKDDYKYSKKNRDYRSPSNDRHSKRRDSSPTDRRSKSGRRSSHEKTSHSSHRSKREKSKRSRSIERESEIQVDTFSQRFERRRSSSVEEVVDNDVVYRYNTPSPDRLKRKKRKNGEKEKKKEKRKEKKRKHKSDKSEVSGEELLTDTEPIVSDIIEIDLNEMESEESHLTITECTKEMPNGDLYGPKMPPIGPLVPSCSPEELLPGNRSTIADAQPQADKDLYGPVAPPRIKDSVSEPNGEEKNSIGEPKKSSLEQDETAKQSTQSGRVYGPVLPQRAPVTELTEEDASFGPALPPRLLKPQQPVDVTKEEEEDDVGFGPQPVGVGGRTQEELEIRAALIKRQLENKDDVIGPKKREDWMIELPENRRSELGLGPRKFRTREAPDMSDRSSWTDTPEEKLKKEELSRLGIGAPTNDEDNTDSRRLGIIERDKEMEAKVKESKKREKSLLETHQKELKKKKKKEEKERSGKPEERRPFSREIDLQTNRFDEAQKRSIIKKAQLLDSRFSAGESKFL